MHIYLSGQKITNKLTFYNILKERETKQIILWQKVLNNFSFIKNNVKPHVRDTVNIPASKKRKRELMRT